MSVPRSLALLSPPCLPTRAAGQVHGAAEAAEATAGGGGGRELALQRTEAEAAAGAGGADRQRSEHDPGDLGAAQPTQVPGMHCCSASEGVRACVRAL